MKRATLGRVEEAVRPRTTRGSGQRATPCEGARSRAQPGSGQPPTPAAEGEAGWDSTQPQRIGEGRRNRGGREGSGKQCATPAAEDEAPPPLCARATPAASTPPCFRLRKKKQSIVYVNYIILYYQYIYFLDQTVAHVMVLMSKFVRHVMSHVMLGRWRARPVEKPDQRLSKKKPS